MKNIVPEENCLTEIQLLRYLHDECSTQEVRAIDRHLTDCPMCTDAVEGAMLLNTNRLERSLKQLNAQIYTQFSDKTMVFELEKPVLTVVKKPNRRLWLWAAASIAVLATAGLLLLTKPFEPLSNAQIASNTEGDSLPNQTTSQAVISPRNEVSQVNPSKNERQIGTESGVTDTKTPAGSDADVALGDESPFVATNTSPVPKMSKPTEDTEESVGDSYKSKAKEIAQAPASSASVNDYPGAAAQNAMTESKTKATREKLPVDNGLADYQIGMQFYTKGDYNAAIAQLNRVLAKQNKGVVYENALWYMANSYLKVGKKQDGQILLQRIVAEKGKFAQQAAALLK